MLIHYLPDTLEIYGYYPEHYEDIPSPTLKIDDEVFNELVVLNPTHVDLKNGTIYAKQTSKNQPPLTLETLQATFKARVNEIMNKEARARGYDDIVSAVSYAGYENAFQKEALAFGKWRSNVWSWGYSLLNQIQNGEISINGLNIDEVLKEMPRLELE